MQFYSLGVPNMWLLVLRTLRPLLNKWTPWNAHWSCQQPWSWKNVQRCGRTGWMITQRIFLTYTFLGIRLMKSTLEKSVFSFHLWAPYRATYCNTLQLSWKNCFGMNIHWYGKLGSPILQCGVGAIPFTATHRPWRSGLVWLYFTYRTNHMDPLCWKLALLTNLVTWMVWYNLYLLQGSPKFHCYRSSPNHSHQMQINKNNHLISFCPQLYTPRFPARVPEHQSWRRNHPSGCWTSPNLHDLCCI